MLEALNLFLRLQVENVGVVVFAAAGEERIVGCERHAPDAAIVLGVKEVGFLLGREIVKADVADGEGNHKEFVVRGDSQVLHV